MKLAETKYDSNKLDAVELFDLKNTVTNIGEFSDEVFSIGQPCPDYCLPNLGAAF